MMGTDAVQSFKKKCKNYFKRQKKEIQVRKKYIFFLQSYYPLQLNGLPSKINEVSPRTLLSPGWSWPTGRHLYFWHSFYQWKQVLSLLKHTNKKTFERSKKLSLIRKRCFWNIKNVVRLNKERSNRRCNTLRTMVKLSIVSL